MSKPVDETIEHFFTNNLCNVEIAGNGLCGVSAKWHNDRYPNGCFCQRHKEKFEGIGNWREL